MSKKLCLVLPVILTATMLLTACSVAAAPVQPTTAPVATAAQVHSTTVPTPTAAPIQPTTVLAATAAPIQPTTTPGEIPQSADLCGGTGGNGQIVSVGNNEFTMKRNDTGSDQIIHLSDGATIQTSTGPAALSDLKLGYRVTLVGGPNPDGSFTADTVVVCN